ncbi:MAG: hypothetical protein JXR36_13635 [Bacteroidales bacterium]|nr:hypothetical protein [Bacteroidales bacterium]
MKKLIGLLASLIVIGVFNLYAPPADPGGGPVGDDPPVGVPIDGGAVALLIGGAAYGVKKIRDKKKTIIK